VGYRSCLIAGRLLALIGAFSLYNDVFGTSTYLKNEESEKTRVQL
jgi:hypothetical protein